MTNVPFINSITNELSKRKLKSNVVANAILDISVGNDRLDDLLTLQSNADKIDAVVNVASSNLSEIHQISRQAVNGVNDNVTFIRIGDSTRSMLSSEWQTYDELIFKQLNMSYYNNADPAQTADDWLNNIDQNTLNQFIENCSGVDGEDTIVEFSLGLNDYTSYGDTPTVKPQVKQILLDCVDAIFQAKPKVKLYLSSPHYAQDEDRRVCLDEVYHEIADERNLFLVDGLAIPIGPEYDFENTDYYNDETNLNQFGMLSLNFYILSKILPLDVVKVIEFSEYTLPQSTGNLADGIPVSIGLWESGDDYYDTSLNTDTEHRYIAVPIPVANIAFQMKFKHAGSSSEVFIKYEDDSVVQITPSSLVNGYYPFFCPAGVKEIYINISTEGTTYDALNDIPELLYSLRDRPFISYDELTKNFKSNITHTRFRDGKLIDDYGFVGKVGQSLIIDANNKMKWSI